MGAPKQKWTPEEESALKAGVVKHGAGKWRTILKDPEFSGMLALRSNVDLKDKWRNISVTANGWGSREKARLAMQKSKQLAKQGGNSLSLNGVVRSDEVYGAQPLISSNGLLQIADSKNPISRLDNLILETITSLKERRGSTRTSIIQFIADQYETPDNFKNILSAELKGLTASGKLIKVKRNYRIAPSGSNPMTTPGGKKTPGVQEAELAAKVEAAKNKAVSAMEAAGAAARAIAEAEAAVAEAELAAREAEAAERDAEAAKIFAKAAKVFAKAAKNALNFKSMPNVTVCG